MKAVPRSRSAACVSIHWSATPSPYGCGISDVGSASSASPARSVTRGASAKVNGRRATGCRVIRSGSNVRFSIPEVTELYGEIGDALLDQRNGVLKLVSLRTGDTHGVTLDARLHLELAVLDELHDLFRELLLDADPDRYHLFDLVAA